MYPRALRVAVITLELGSSVFLLVLLITPASKHAIVKALVTATILRSLFDFIPPLVYDTFPQGSAILSGSFARLCIADAIILRYFTVVKAAFAIIFTVPCLVLAYRHSRSGSARQLSIEEASNPFTRRTIVFFCVGPFVWALPTIVIPICKLARNPNGFRPVIENTTTCHIDDSAFQITSLVLILIPLSISILAAVGLVFTLCQYCYGFARQTLGWQPVRIFRFGALIVTIIISAVLYTIILAEWVGYEYEHQDYKGISAALTASTVWEAVYPWTILVIFAAQDEVFQQWLEWGQQLFPLFETSSGASDDTNVSQHQRHSDVLPWAYKDYGRGDGAQSSCDQEREGDSRSLSTVLSDNHDLKVLGAAVIDISEKNSVTHPQKQYILEHIAPTVSIHPPGRTSHYSSPSVDGLPLPPRAAQSRSGSPRNAVASSIMPQNTVTVLDPHRDVSDVSIDTQSEHDGADRNGESKVALQSAWYSHPPSRCSQSSFRPPTSGSTGTFGNMSEV